MGETPKSCINGSSATKPLTRKIWGTLNDYPLDAKSINRSTAQMYGVGEIPLNGNGMPLTDNAEGEEIV